MKNYDNYIKILKNELVYAMGCTEPVSIAYGASIIKEKLNAIPSRILVKLSGNIIKNVKSVIVPSTNGECGIDVCIACGLIIGRPEKKLELLADVLITKEEIKCLFDQCSIEIDELESIHPFDMIIEAWHLEHHCSVHIQKSHTNVTSIVLDGQELVLYNESDQAEVCDKNILTVKEIYDFVDNAKLEDFKELIEKQIDSNMAIAEEGLKNNYGAMIGKILYANGNLISKAKGYAAAGSDARMNGCGMPVCIISGSGNQGITTCVPISVYAKEYNIGHEKLLRAVLLSDLLTIHQKTGIGCLSAYCGVIVAGASSGAGICYLLGGSLKDICHTFVNAVAILSGTICDGAKSSCAAKIAMAVEAGILGYEMNKYGTQFYSGDGIVKKGIENTINNVSKLARCGMIQTDKEIIKIMLDKN